MIVQGRHLDPFLPQFLEDGSHLVLREDQIAVDNGLAAGFCECDPTSQRQTRLDLNSLDGD